MYVFFRSIRFNITQRIFIREFSFSQKLYQRSTEKICKKCLRVKEPESNHKNDVIIR